MPIIRFIWTAHAWDKRTKRLLDGTEIERGIRDGHAERQINRGEADWLVKGMLPDGRRFEAVYDHPHHSDHSAARIVSVWDC
jgi:hypothetical protein